MDPKSRIENFAQALGFAPLEPVRKAPPTPAESSQKYSRLRAMPEFQEIFAREGRGEIDREEAQRLVREMFDAMP